MQRALSNKVIAAADLGIDIDDVYLLLFIAVLVGHLSFRLG